LDAVSVAGGASEPLWKYQRPGSLLPRGCGCGAGGAGDGAGGPDGAGAWALPLSYARSGATPGPVTFGGIAIVLSRQ
jgi:hypothetical protein